MTFTERIEHRRRWGALLAILGFLMISIVAAALIFVISVTTPPIYVTSIIVGIIALFAYFGGWVTARFFADNIDGVVQEMGPIRRKMLIGAIIEEGKVEEYLKSMEDLSVPAQIEKSEQPL